MVVGYRNNVFQVFDLSHLLLTQQLLSGQDIKISICRDFLSKNSFDYTEGIACEVIVIPFSALIAYLESRK